MVYLCVDYTITGYLSETSMLRAGMAFDANPVNPTMSWMKKPSFLL